uniref:Uncharacterized protein n=1 Tax=Salix viminalis TaxID=40686 RepID=A0A6N2LGH2_SALVM
MEKRMRYFPGEETIQGMTHAQATSRLQYPQPESWRCQFVWEKVGALASGYLPIAAGMVSPEISDGSTKLLLVCMERNILDQVNRIAPKFQDGVKAFSDSPIIGEIRGSGLILGTEFVDNNSPNDPFPLEWGFKMPVTGIQ